MLKFVITINSIPNIYGKPNENRGRKTTGATGTNFSYASQLLFGENRMPSQVYGFFI